MYGVERMGEFMKGGAIACWILAIVGESEIRRMCKQLNGSPFFLEKGLPAMTEADPPMTVVH